MIDPLLTYKVHMYEWIEALETCLKKRTKQNEVQLLTRAVTLLATNGWSGVHRHLFGYETLEAVCERFRVPLESAGVELRLGSEGVRQHGGIWQNIPTTRSTGGSSSIPWMPANGLMY